MSRPRPSERDLDIRRLAAIDICKDLDEEVNETNIASIARALRSGDDGYQLAREMDDDGWEVDEGTVGILRGASYHLRDHHRTAVRAWVAETNPVNPVPLGEMAALTGGVFGEGRQGKVVKINADLATSTVSEAAKGHGENGGWVMPWERLQPAGGAG